mmetsp:Transcript_25480/g.54825  ORF Transcript_25480/g.54825 Transcript_25480/m.54825 type:complete len:204 (-) Transcript_25480:1179-1790(-)
MPPTSPPGAPTALPLLPAGPMGAGGWDDERLLAGSSPHNAPLPPKLPPAAPHLSTPPVDDSADNRPRPKGLPEGANEAPPISPFCKSAEDNGRGCPPRIPLPPNSNDVVVVDAGGSPIDPPPKLPEKPPMRGEPMWRLDPLTAPMGGPLIISLLGCFAEDSAICGTAGICPLALPDPDPTDESEGDDGALLVVLEEECCCCCC